MGAGIYINYSKIFLDKNKMTRFDSEVFRPVLEQMAPHPEFPGSYISIGNSSLYRNSTLLLLSFNNSISDL